MIAVPLKDRVRMYLLVTLVCAILALAFRFFLTGPGQMRNYAEEQLDTAVNSTVPSRTHGLSP